MEGKHRVVLQITEADPITQLTVIGQIRNIRKELPDAEIEVVCHANGVDMLLRSGSRVAAHVQELSADNVKFQACKNTLVRIKVSDDDLLPGAQTVPSGLVEIILKQESGWSYLRLGK